MMRFWFGNGAWASDKARKYVANMQPSDVRRIAVIRHAALGDMVMLRPFLIEIRKHFPNAELTLSLVSHYTYAAPSDLVDKIHVIYGTDNRTKSIREQVLKMRELGEQDIIFDCACTSRSLWLNLLTKAKLKVGYPFRTWQRYVFYDAAVFRSDFVFEADTMLHMLQVFGFKTQHPPMPCIPGNATKREKKYILYFPSASTPEKCWPHDSYARLISLIASEYPEFEHVVMKGIAKWESIHEILKKFEPSSSKVTGVEPSSFEECIGWIKGAEIVIANDTGIRNLAIIAGIPTIGILFSTYMPYRYWPNYGLHDCVFTRDALIPAVDMVMESARRIIDQLPS